MLKRVHELTIHPYCFFVKQGQPFPESEARTGWVSIVDPYQLAAFINDVVTACALPAAILSFWVQRNNERENKERVIYESLSSSYDEFLRLVLQNPDLKLWTKEASRELSDEQEERLIVLFRLLASLFERAYLLTYSEQMTMAQARRWGSWDNHMRQWCRREDFRIRLPRLLRGDDPNFVAHLERLADEVLRDGS